MRYEGLWNPAPPTSGYWHLRPWWIFWQPTHRRRSWREAGDMWIPYWEYQHVAFVAREALERAFNNAGRAKKLDLFIPDPRFYILCCAGVLGVRHRAGACPTRPRREVRK
jgi:hypothetical protein